ncbi:MAG TPA: SMC-Scp complex subunit ScpB [Actinomycetota bacterium]|nr:SMC-Scp complex subunit ScpB [Actinomycetota bacterium]
MPEPAGLDGRLRALEAVLFVADEPLSAAVLGPLVEADRRTVERLLEELAERYERTGSGLTLRRVAGGWRVYTHPDAAPVVERFVLSSRHTRLTRAALETMAIVAYKQPVTRHQVAAIRGVDSEGVLKALVERGLLAEVGREDGPGRPVLYGTTPEFLERLGLDSVGDLPSLAPLLGSGDDGERDDAEEVDAAGAGADGAPEPEDRAGS